MPVGRASGWAGIAYRLPFWISALLGRYGIKSDDRTGLRVKGGNTSDAVVGITMVTAR